jgi:hypothetical protein
MVIKAAKAVVTNPYDQEALMSPLEARAKIAMKNSGETYFRYGRVFYHIKRERRWQNRSNLGLSWRGKTPGAFTSTWSDPPTRTMRED